jgi:hypothetical protein
MRRLRAGAGKRITPLDIVCMSGVSYTHPHGKGGYPMGNTLKRWWLTSVAALAMATAALADGDAPTDIYIIGVDRLPLARSKHQSGLHPVARLGRVLHGLLCCARAGEPAGVGRWAGRAGAPASSKVSDSPRGGSVAAAHISPSPLTPRNTAGIIHTNTHSGGNYGLSRRPSCRATSARWVSATHRPLPTTSTTASPSTTNAAIFGSAMCCATASMFWTLKGTAYTNCTVRVHNCPPP